MEELHIMRIHRVFAALAVALCIDARPALPQPTVNADERVDRIVGMAMARGGALAFLQRLTDSIGGRVTGSPESKATADLLLSTLHEAGFDDARLEEYAIESRWHHGRAVGRVVSPVARQLAIGSYGWVPGTKGEVTAPLVDLGAPSNNDLPVPADRVRGAAVIVDPQSHGRGAGAGDARSYGPCTRRRRGCAMLIPSDKPNRMLYTSAFGFYPQAPLPVLSIAREDVLFLRRLLDGGPVRVTLDVVNTIDTSAGQERNVVVDIKGTTPGEVVLVGAHFDSWDSGQGAQDDGVGVAAILEAARILKSIGIKPRRTIRFVFFSGEEQATPRLASLRREAPKRTRSAARSGDHGLRCANATRVPDPRAIGHRDRGAGGAGPAVIARGVGSEPRGQLRHGPWAVPGVRDSSLDALGRRGRVRHPPPRGLGHLRQGGPATCWPLTRRSWRSRPTVWRMPRSRRGVACLQSRRGNY